MSDTYLFGSGVLTGVFVGIGIGVIAVNDDIQSAPIFELTASESGTGIHTQYTIPTTFLVTFMDPAEIKQRAPDALAFATPLSQPCHVYLPTNMTINFHTGVKRAWWQSREDGDMVAHEMLHCMRGFWHGRDNQPK